MNGIKLIPNQDGSFSLVQERLGTPSGQVIYSGQGLFGLCMNSQLINASVRGPGIANWLNWRGSIYKLNDSGILTHVGRNPNLEDDYTPPETTCGDCEYGTYTFCEFNWCFGEYCVNTLERKVTDVGARFCEATPIYRIYGAATDELGRELFPQNSQITDDDEWSVVVAAAQMATIIGRQIWRGTGAMAGVHREMLGLETQNNTGWSTLTGEDCPGADPDVKHFDACIGDLYNGHSICEYVEALVTNAMWRSVTAGLGAIPPGGMALWTYPDIAIALVKAWECCMSQTCEPLTGSAVQVMVNADEVLRARRAQGFIDGMFQAGTINVQGMEVPVFGDLGLTHTVVGNQVFADIHLFVKRVGALETMFGEFQDFNQTIPTRLANTRNAHYIASDGGRFAITFNHQSWCYAESIEIKPRVIVRAPFLNGRITDVCANTLQRLPTPADVYGGMSVPPALVCEGGQPTR